MMAGGLEAKLLVYGVSRPDRSIPARRPPMEAKPLAASREEEI
jgi:hypothetical protein